MCLLVILSFTDIGSDYYVEICNENYIFEQCSLKERSACRNRFTKMVLVKLVGGQRFFYGAHAHHPLSPPLLVGPKIKNKKKLNILWLVQFICKSG